MQRGTLVFNPGKVGSCAAPTAGEDAENTLGLAAIVLQKLSRDDPEMGARRIRKARRKNSKSWPEEFQKLLGRF